MPVHNLRLKLIDADLELKEKTDVTYEDLVDKVNIESEKKKVFIWKICGMII